MKAEYKEYVKQFTLREISDRYNFEKTDVIQGMSFVLNCIFLKTKYDNTYITDYDLRSDEDLEKKDLSMLFYKNKGVFNSQIISNVLLKDENLFNETLESFNKECLAL